MKRHALLVAVFGVLLAGIGGITLFADSFAKDISDTKKNIDVIQDEYDKFKNLLQSFTGDREIIYSDVFNNLYLETVEGNYDNWYIKLQEYENTTNKIFGYKTFLQEKCVGVIYNDSNTQSKCDSMLISYETVNNYFVKDINKWNDFINEFNNQVEDVLYSKKLFDLNTRNYIDFNDDGEYLGK